MSDKKLFLVNKLSLEERLHERISQLENENKCLIETLHNKDALMNVEEEKQQLAYNQEHLDGLREALEVFNECFSQKNSVELTPSLEENKKKIREMVIDRLKLGEAAILIGSTPYIHISNFNTSPIGKKHYFFDVPGDLRELSKHLNKVLIGYNRWGNDGQKFLCIAMPIGDLFYFDVDAMNKLLRWVLSE